MAGYDEPNDLNSAALLRARVHPALTGLDGAGIVIIVIDYGFDLHHPAFRTPSGETRFAALIDQNGGRLERAEINTLLRASDKTGDRSAADAIYDPHAHYFGRDGVQVGVHGSWVASIAAGSRTAEFCGVAPKATLVGVQLDLPDSAWREEDENGQPTWLRAALDDWDGWRAYEDSPAIVSALRDGLAFASALNPEGIVVNLSIGAWAGGHDANSPVNRTIEEIIDVGNQPGEPMVAVVTGTGNAGADEGHVVASMTQTDPARFGWSFPPGCAAPSKLEIWSDCPGGITVEVTSRCGESRAICKLDGSTLGTSAIMFEGGQVIGVAENRGPVRNDLSAARIILCPALLSRSLLRNSLSIGERSTFGITATPAQDSGSGTLHAWLERSFSDQPPSKLTQNDTEKRQNARASSTEFSLTSIACAPSVIAIAGLDTAAADDAVIAMSGRGPRPWPVANALPSPLLAAPANGLFGARSKTTGYMRGSGTSGAAAVVSGACTLAMQAADLAGHRLDTVALVNALLGRPIDLLSNDNWRPDLGHGALRFDTSAILAAESYPRNHPVMRQEVIRDERTISPPN